VELLTSIENVENGSDPVDNMRSAFATEMLRGLVRFGLVGSGGGQELLLELGVSTWMRNSGAPLGSLRTSMLEVRDALIEAGELDPGTEPVPLLGRSDRADVLNLASYLCALVTRAASTAGCPPAVVAERAIGALTAHTPVVDPVDRATG
jgi:hypothetical protein